LYTNIPTDELTKQFHVPCEKESFDTVFWTSREHQKGVTPKWVTIPHSASTLKMALENNPVNAINQPNRFKSSREEYRFPADDNLFTRDIVFSTFQEGSEYFIRITEDFTSRGIKRDSGSIVLSWRRYDRVYGRLKDINDIPLPPAIDFDYIRQGTYQHRRVFDQKRGITYVIEIIHEPHMFGWTRFLQLSMETTNNPNLIGLIRIPWHLTQDFLDHLSYFSMKYRYKVRNF
jgi:hypothetical protein